MLHLGMSPSLTSDAFRGRDDSPVLNLSGSVWDLDWREPLASDLSVSPPRNRVVAALSVEVKLADFSCAGDFMIEESRSLFCTIVR